MSSHKRFLYELIDHLTVCLENGYMTNGVFKTIEAKIESLIKRLNGYIKYLNNQKEAIGK